MGNFAGNSFFTPSVGLAGRVQGGFCDMNVGHISPSMPSMEVDSVDAPKADFKGVMSNLAQNLSQEMNAPDKLLKSAMNGDKDVDIHDVMTAMAKAEMTVSIATQVTSKVIQAYDKIMQISV